MKIGPPVETVAPPAVTPAGSGVVRAAAGEAGTAAGASPATRSAGGTENASTVRLSATATSLKTMASTPEFDAGKVEAMRQAIEDRTFKVDAGAIADRLLSGARELLGRVSH